VHNGSRAAKHEHESIGAIVLSMHDRKCQACTNGRLPHNLGGRKDSTWDMVSFDGEDSSESNSCACCNGLNVESIPELVLLALKSRVVLPEEVGLQDLCPFCKGLIRLPKNATHSKRVRTLEFQCHKHQQKKWYCSRYAYCCFSIALIERCILLQCVLKSDECTRSKGIS
jgi:hypothetical protein